MKNESCSSAMCAAAKSCGCLIAAGMALCPGTSKKPLAQLLARGALHQLALRAVALVNGWRRRCGRRVGRGRHECGPHLQEHRLHARHLAWRKLLHASVIAVVCRGSRGSRQQSSRAVCAGRCLAWPGMRQAGLPPARLLARLPCSLAAAGGPRPANQTSIVGVCSLHLHPCLAPLVLYFPHP